MSLQVDESSRRARSRSPGGRERDRSRVRGSSVSIVDAVPYPSSTDALRDPSSTAYEYERLSSWPSAAVPDDDRQDYYRGPPRGKPADDLYADARREVQYVYDRDRDRDSPASDREKARPQRESLYLPQKYAAQIKTAEPPASPRESRDSLRDKERDSSRERKERERRRKKEKLEEDLAYGKLPGPSKHAAAPESPPAAATYVYAQPKPWEYDMPEEARYGATYLDPSSVRPAGGGGGRRSPSPGPTKSALKRDRSPQPPTARMSTLTVQTPHHSASLSVSAAPPSPLLEAYHGTYQSMSPMPSPLLLPTSPSAVQVLDALSPIASDDERGDKAKQRSSRRARFHDPVDDAARLAKALKGEKRAPETEPLIEILPGLTHEQVMELRVEYKRLVRTGPDRKGVNVAKHIRARLKDEDPMLMKACYATALGRWESEAYWANFWYHGDKTRRELLIEALMGRTNEEIRAIKAGFSDKKYGNSLVRCMKTELKEDKFKKAVLLVLDETRMEETDGQGRPARIDRDLVAEDVRQLWRAVGSERGGESLMIEIVTQRSDAHLREVLREYREKHKGANFAKDALRKSGNLVVSFPSSSILSLLTNPIAPPLIPSPPHICHIAPTHQCIIPTGRGPRAHPQRGHQPAGA